MTLLATGLHPTGRGLFGSFELSRASRPMVVLVAAAAVPLLADAIASAGLQRGVADEHAALGHYGFMAAFAVTVVAVGLLASLRPDGWWLPAWVAGVLAALLGLVSLVFPDVESGLPPLWAVAAIVWGVAFVAVAELTQDARYPSLIGWRGGAVQRSESATARVIAAVGLVAVFAVAHLAGGLGPGAHGASGAGADHGQAAGGQAGAGAAAGPVRTIRVTALDAMTFEPGRVDVAAGETVTFVVTNTGRAVHEFTVGDASEQRRHGEEMVRTGGMTHDELGSVRLQPGETKQLTWRFGGAGTLEYGCHEPGHYEAGMRGMIAVS